MRKWQDCLGIIVAKLKRHQLRCGSLWRWEGASCRSRSWEYIVLNSTAFILLHLEHIRLFNSASSDQHTSKQSTVKPFIHTATRKFALIVTASIWIINNKCSESIKLVLNVQVHQGGHPSSSCCTGLTDNLKDLQLMPSLQRYRLGQSQFSTIFSCKEDSSTYCFRFTLNDLPWV